MTLLVWPILIFILALFLAAIITTVVMWLGYRLVVSAVRSGVLEANAEQARRDQGLPPSNWSILAARVAEPVEISPAPYTPPQPHAD